MFRKILIAAGTAAGVVATALTFQTSANAADIRFGIQIGDGFHADDHGKYDRHGYDGYRGYQSQHGRHFNDGRGFYKPAPKFEHHALSNQEIRYQLRRQGLYNIRIIDRHHGVAKVIADHRRGYVGQYSVNTRNGYILESRLLRYHDDHRGRHGRYQRSSQVSFFLN